MNLEKLQAKYSKQTNRFWANIESTFRHSVLNSKDPSIVLVVNDQQTRNVSAILVDDIVKLYFDTLNRQQNSWLIDPSKDADLIELIRSENSDKVKMVMDDRLKAIFDHGDKIALIKNVQVLPAKSMLLFMSYGDLQAYAKYQGVLIIMTLDVGEEFDEQERAKLTRKTDYLYAYVQNYLTKLWSKIVGPDQLEPLYTRIANNVILVSPEDDLKPAKD